MNHKESESSNRSNSKRFMDGLCRIESHILVFFLISIALFVFAEVVMRHVGITIDGIEEFSSLLLVWLVYGGIALAETRDQHLRFRLSTEIFPHVIRRLIAFSTKLCMMILIVFVVLGEIEVLRTAARARTQVLQWPVILWYLSILVGFVMLGFHFTIGEAVRIGRLLRGND